MSTYDESKHPRVPAGKGDASGQWASAENAAKQAAGVGIISVGTKVQIPSMGPRAIGYVHEIHESGWIEVWDSLNAIGGRVLATVQSVSDLVLIPDEFETLAASVRQRLSSGGEVDFQEIVTLATTASEKDQGVLNEILTSWHNRQMAIPKKASSGLSASDMAGIEGLRRTGNTASKAMKGQRF